MKKLETVKISDASSAKGIMKNYDIPLQYCDVCFISLGSQEKRIFMDGKVVHLDCEKKVKS